MPPAPHMLGERRMKGRRQRGSVDNCVCVQHSTARMCAGVCGATLLPAGMAGREPTRADLLQPTAVEMSVEVSALDSCAPRIAQKRLLVEGLRLHRLDDTGSCQGHPRGAPRTSFQHSAPAAAPRCRQLRCPCARQAPRGRQSGGGRNRSGAAGRAPLPRSKFQFQSRPA